MFIRPAGAAVPAEQRATRTADAEPIGWVEPQLR
jgi:hypothetical protein